MRFYRKPSRLIVVAGSVLALATMAIAPSASAAAPYRGPACVPAAQPKIHANASDDGGGESDEIMDSSEQYAAVRTAPGTSVSPAAFAAATAAAANGPSYRGGRWQEVTNQPYNSDALGYRDPVWSNSSGGAGLVAGRMTALAVDGTTIYAGAAAGGVWRSTDGGAHWTPVFDQQNNLSIGALAVNPADHSIWVGTGEAEHQRGLLHRQRRLPLGRRRPDLAAGRQRAAQLPRLPAHLRRAGARVRRHQPGAAPAFGALDLTSRWTTVLKPDPNPAHSPYRTSFITDVKVQPGTDGKVVIAALGWRGGTLPTDIAVQRLLPVDRRRPDVQPSSRSPATWRAPPTSAGRRSPTRPTARCSTPWWSPPPRSRSRACTSRPTATWPGRGS